MEIDITDADLFDAKNEIEEIRIELEDTNKKISGISGLLKDNMFSQIGNLGGTLLKTGFNTLSTTVNSKSTL